MGGTARRPGTRLAESDTQETLVRPALWALSSREDGSPPETHFPITLPTAAARLDSDDPWLDARGPSEPARKPVAALSSPSSRGGRRGLPAGRGVWAVCATLVLITLSGLAFAAFPAQARHPAARAATTTVAGQGAVADDPLAGALALGQNGAKQVVAQTSPVSSGTGEPCIGPVQFPATIDTWTAPLGCYAIIYTPNPANYISRPGFGYCNWWVRVMDPAHPDITENTSYPRGSVPRVGAAVFFDGGVQGADPAGHWSRVEAIAPDGYWMLVSEMNFAWRGGGFGKVDYRFAHTGPGVTFIYA